MMFFLINTAIMIAVFVLVLLFSLEALKLSTFSTSTRTIIALCVALLSATSLCSFPVAVGKDGFVTFLLLPYQALGLTVLVLALAGLAYRLLGQKKRAELLTKIRKFFQSID